MNKLTAEKCRSTIESIKMRHASIREEIYLQALEIALPVLEEQVKEQHIGVWNPATKEIAVNHKSGIKLVDITHWHCHCTMEVIVREIAGHPLVKARNTQTSTTQIENDGWIEWGGGDRPVDGDTKVQIEWSDGSVVTGTASSYGWTGLCFGRIVAYRVIENDGREG